MDGGRMDGGFDHGATLGDGTVRRVAGPWTEARDRTYQRMIVLGRDRHLETAFAELADL